MITIKLTARECEAVSWAVGNFAGGDEHDCQSASRYRAMCSAANKIPCTRVRVSAKVNRLHREQTIQ